MLTENSLRNLNKFEYVNFFKVNGVENYKKRLMTSSRSDYSRIEALLKREIHSSTGSFTIKRLDEFLYHQLFYIKNNHHYVYQLDSHFILENNMTGIEEIRKYLVDYKDLKFDELIPHVTHNDFEICTTRIEENTSGNVEQINILIKCDEVATKRGEITLYCGVTIDIKNMLLLIKFNQNYLESYPSKALLIKDIKSALTSNTIFRPLKLQFSSILEDNGREFIFSLFKDLSEDAEKILNKKASPDTDEKITKFLNGMNVEIKNDYINQVKAVIYQDIADTFHETLFPNGWVFRFLFREGDYTRASSRTDDYSPIYKTKVYWNLKEIVFKEKKMQEAGLLWNLPKTNGKVFVRIESKNDSILIHYYENKTANHVNRKEKEAFVLQKVNADLPRN